MLDNPAPSEFPATPRFRARRDTARWNEKLFEYRSLGEFQERKRHASGLHSIEAAGGVFDFLLWDRGATTTVVFFHAGLVAERDMDLPVFAGRRVVGDKVNAIFVCDPSLYLSKQLRIGWFSGFLGCPAPPIIRIVLAAMLESVGSTRTVFMGASAGGFAALMASWYFPRSLAIAMNPQTNLANFNLVSVARYASVAFGSKSREEAVETLHSNILVDLTRLYAKKVPNWILYLQNGKDKHVQLHQEPFFKALDPSQHYRTRLVLGDWGEGHAPPPRGMIERLIRLVSEQQDNWRGLISGDFQWLQGHASDTADWW